MNRGHVIESILIDRPQLVKVGLVCGMKGCDEKAIKGKGSPCECGFKICGEYYLDCFGTGGGHCPGCKEPYKDASDDDERVNEDDCSEAGSPCECGFKI